MDYPRRNVFGAGGALGAAGSVTEMAAATPGNPDKPVQSARNTQGKPRAAADPGPQNPVISGQFPQAFTPPPTNAAGAPGARRARQPARRSRPRRVV
jgi:oxalate decarboxylase